jgi:predicted Zn finger-like uncharacterized protein
VHIVCPHCTTSYAIDMAALGPSGRTVRCSRCKEVWLARPEDALAAAPAMAETSPSGRDTDPAAEWGALAREEGGQPAPLVDSPPIAGAWQEDDSSQGEDWAALAREDGLDSEDGRPRTGWLHMFSKRPARAGMPRKTSFDLRLACAAMGALVVALIVWRTDVVKLLPQTANFYKMVGLEVNLRGLLFKDVKVTSETVEGKPVLVIEGTIVSETLKAADVPRLRFSVRDGQGAEIYAWNALLEQTVLKPGDHAQFKSRLASPPAEGRSIDIRFFNKHDIAGGSA